MKYEVTNKKLNQVVGIVDEKQKESLMNGPLGKGKFIFRQINEASAPVAAKKADKADK